MQAKIRQASGRHEVEREAWLQQLRRSNALDGVAGRAFKEEQYAEEERAQCEIEDRPRLKLPA